MAGSTRRNFLIASGAAGVAAAVTTTAEASPLRGRAARPVQAPADAQPMVAHIGDPHSGVISLLVGEREVVVKDPDLVGRITRAAKGV